MTSSHVTRRALVRGAVAAGAAIGLAPSGRTAGASQRSRTGLPNIVLIMSDDQGCRQVGYAGNPRVHTPHLDALARNGLIFERFYAAGAICSPSRVACLTGRFPSRYPNGNTLRAEVNALDITIPVALKTKGYVTGHFGKRHGNPAAAGGYDEVFLTGNDRLSDPENNKSSAIVIWRRARPFLRSAATAGTPFFCTLWFHEPHLPTRALAKYRQRYRDGEPELYADISQMDDQIGLLRKELRDLGVSDNTLLWFCSDNGAMSAEGSGLRGGKSDIYEGGLRVPAALEWPAVVKPGRTTQVRACHTDGYPTILGLFGIRMPKQPPVDGVDLAALIRGGAMDRRPTPMFFWALPDEGEPRPTWAVIDGRYKFMSALEGALDLDMLFDLDVDPDERDNLASRRPELVHAFKEQLRAWVRTASVSQTGSDYRRS